MADHYITIGSYATVKVTGPATAVDVLRITFQTIPSNVVATVSAPYRGIAGFKVADVTTVANVFIGPIAFGIEEMMGLGVVESAVGVEDTNASGLLIDYIEATVFYQSPNPAQGIFTSPVRIEAYAFGEQPLFGRLVRDPILAAQAALKALAGL